MAFFVFFDFAQNALGGQNHAGNRCRILQRYARYFLRINYTRSDQVLVLFSSGVVTEVVFAFHHLLNYDATFATGVSNDLT